MLNPTDISTVLLNILAFGEGRSAHGVLSPG